MLQLVLRIPAISDVLINTDMLAKASAGFDRGLRLVWNLREMARDWVENPMSSWYINAITDSLGDPFNKPSDRGSGQQHCAMDALSRLLLLLEEGLQHYPAVSCMWCQLLFQVIKCLLQLLQNYLLCVLQKFEELNKSIGDHVLNFRVFSDGKVVRLPRDSGVFRVVTLGMGEGVTSLTVALDLWCHGYAEADATRDVKRFADWLETMFVNLPRVQVLPITPGLVNC